jgi:hypothetical protein
MAMSFRLFEDGTYYILYNPANLGSIGDGHVIQGSGTAASGVFTSSDAMLYPVSNVPFSALLRQPPSWQVRTCRRVTWHC